MNFRIIFFILAPLVAFFSTLALGDGFTSALFYAFSTVTVLSAVSVITVRNPVYASLFLVLCFFSTAMIWMLLKAEFLAIVLVLVYVGAVMVLFLFVVMMLDVNFSKLREGYARYLPAGLIVGGIMVAEMAAVLINNYKADLNTAVTGMPGNNTKLLGQAMYTGYVFHIQVAAVILLVAMIAAIALTLRHRKDVRYNDPSAAVRVKAADRIKIVSVPHAQQQAAPPKTS
jgi:NADH-quinone oxidoreductase subunit J